MEIRKKHYLVIKEIREIIEMVKVIDAMNQKILEKINPIKEEMKLKNEETQEN